ncbi:hypothetical protein [Streptosporangium sp. NPDC051022]|uniref:hypothetical protein n=1 Tax=Streptosporangium sp. NPDC051022 TaxID=3155752 RepID=UPI003433955C
MAVEVAMRGAVVGGDEGEGMGEWWTGVRRRWKTAMKVAVVRRDRGEGSEMRAGGEGEMVMKVVVGGDGS